MSDRLKTILVTFVVGAAFTLAGVGLIRHGKPSGRLAVDLVRYIVGGSLAAIGALSLFGTLIALVTRRKSDSDPR